MDAYNIQDKSAQTNANHQISFHSKPMMIYYFVDPLSSDCWITDTHLKKMTIEYGAYFNLRPVIMHDFFIDANKWNRTSQDVKMNRWNRYYLTMSIQAATMQGNRIGRTFLRHIQQLIFLHHKDFSNANEQMIHSIVHQAAKKSSVDLKEFYQDLFSYSVEKTFVHNNELKREMNVQQFPTFVFYSHLVDDYGVKVSGVQNYETYTFILEDMLQIDLPIQKRPRVQDTIAYFNRLQTEDIAFICDCSHQEAEKQLKQLQLKQLVKNIEVNGYQLWEYCG